MLKLLFDDIKSLDFPSTEHKWSFYFLALPLGFTMGLQELEVPATVWTNLRFTPFVSIPSCIRNEKCVYDTPQNFYEF